MDPRSAIDRPARAGRVPPRPRVKICGLRDEAMIDIALARGADEIGLVHFEPSPRHLLLGRIAELARHVAGRAGVVIVTVDPGDETIVALTDIAPDALQLHGHETPERVRAIRERFDLRLMKAVSVGADGLSIPIESFLGVADRLLLDAKAPKGAALPGGNGVPFDWNLLASIEVLRRMPFMLSGGLHAGNVGEAIRIARPDGIDVSSGVESAPGLKSADLLHRFFDALEASLELDAGRQMP